MVTFLGHLLGDRPSLFLVFHIYSLLESPQQSEVLGDYYYYLISIFLIGKLRHRDVRQLAYVLHPVSFWAEDSNQAPEPLLATSGPHCLLSNVMSAGTCPL